MKALVEVLPFNNLTRQPIRFQGTALGGLSHPLSLQLPSPPVSLQSTEQMDKSGCVLYASLSCFNYTDPNGKDALGILLTSLEK